MHALSGPRTEEFTVEGVDGNRLAAYLDLPAAEPVALALFAHCFTGSAALPSATRIADTLVAAGIAVVRFDFAGLGESEGDFADSTFTTDCMNLVRVATAVSESRRPPDLLIGHSLGGAAVLAAASRIRSVRAVATIGAPYEPHHVTHLFDDALEQIRSEGQAEVKLGPRTMTVGRDLVEDLASVDQRAAIAELSVPILVMHSPEDATVDIHNAQSIYRDAGMPKSFLALDGADHLLLRPGHAARAGALVAVWAEKYLDGSARPDLISPGPGPAG